MISVLQKLYYEVYSKNLPIYGVSTKSLKDFLTTDKDLLRGASKIPSNDFRMWELDMIEDDLSR